MSDRILYIQTPSLAKTPVGQAQASPDLSGYATKEEVNTALGGKADRTDVHNIPSGGVAGQFLVKQSATDYDAAWVTVPDASGVSF